MLIISNFLIKTVFAAAGTQGTPVPTFSTGQVNLGFNVPSVTVVIGFLIKGFFVIAGLTALLYLLLGAFAWVTSGGEKEAVGKAREKIQAAVIGLIVIFAVLTIVVLLENLLGIGLGLSKEIVFPQLINQP